MADKPISLQKLVNADKDADTLEQVTSADKYTTIVSRLGRQYPSLAKALQTIIDAGGFKPYSTEAELKASVPVIVPSAAYAFDTKKVWLWNGSAWLDEGTSALDQAITYAIKLNVQKYNDFFDNDLLYSVSDIEGNQTWLQVKKEDGGLSEYSTKKVKEALKFLQSPEFYGYLYSVTDLNGNPSAMTVRNSDGMFPDFVINNIQDRISKNGGAVTANFKTYSKPVDFQILSSIARAIKRNISGIALPANPFDYVNSLNQGSRIYFPAGYSDSTPIPLVMVFDGAGGTSGVEPPTIRSQYMSLLNNGIAMCKSRAHGTSYGNRECMQDYLELYQKACEIAPIGAVILVGNSMGAIAAQNALLTNSIPNVCGLYLTDPTYDLRQRYDDGRKDEISLAYGISSDGSNYYEKTEGYDPSLRHWSEYKGVPIFIRASSLDTLVPLALHGKKLESYLSGHNKVTLVDTNSAGHNSADRFNAEELIGFIKKQCITGSVIL